LAAGEARASGSQRSGTATLEVPAALPRLVEEGDLKGVFHNHSQYSDGANSVEEMALAAREMGYEYLGLSDHSQTAFYASGLKAEDIERQHAEIDELNEKLEGITILKGIESDILKDGSLDYDEEILARFDFVVASVHQRFGLSGAEQTERCIAAVSNPFTTILGHPTGRLLLARDPFEVDMEAVMEAAADSGCVIELNANPHRLDLDWRELRRAQGLGLKISIGPDAHRTEGLRDVRYGVAMARKGWLRAEDVLNTMGLSEIRAYLRDRARRR
jgi:DNA polymerase (family 10)